MFFTPWQEDSKLKSRPCGYRLGATSATAVLWWMMMKPEIPV